MWFREVRVAGITPSDPACAQGAGRSRGFRAPLGVDCRRQPAAGAGASEFAPPARSAVASDVRHGPQPSVPRWDSPGRKKVDPASDYAWRRSYREPVGGAPDVVDRARSRNQCPPLLAALSRSRWHSGLGRGCRLQGQFKCDSTPSQPGLGTGSGHRRTSALRAAGVGPTLERASGADEE